MGGDVAVGLDEELNGDEDDAEALEDDELLAEVFLEHEELDALNGDGDHAEELEEGELLLELLLELDELGAAFDDEADAELLLVDELDDVDADALLLAECDDEELLEDVDDEGGL